MENIPTEGGVIQPPYQPAAKDQSGLAVASLVVGLVSMTAWLLPICGLPLSITGLVLGILARDSTKKGMAITGVVLSIVALVLSIINSVIEVYLGLNGYKGFLQ